MSAAAGPPAPSVVAATRWKTRSSEVAGFQASRSGARIAGAAISLAKGRKKGTDEVDGSDWSGALSAGAECCKQKNENENAA